LTQPGSTVCRKIFDKETTPLDWPDTIHDWGLKYLVYGGGKHLGLFNPAQGNRQKVFPQADLQII
jgi:hypothetical protein